MQDLADEWKRRRLHPFCEQEARACSGSVGTGRVEEAAMHCDGGMQLVTCFLQVGICLPSSPLRTQSAYTKCLLSVPTHRIVHAFACENGMDGRHAMQGMFISIPEDVDCSVQKLVREGLDGVVAPPCSSVCCGRGEIPFFLRDLTVRCLVFSPDTGKLSARESGKRCRTPHTKHGSSSSNSFHPFKAPAFENICGSVYLPGLKPESLPPAVRQSQASCAVFGGSGAASVRGGRSSSWFMSMNSTEVFTVHGNMVLRRQGNGTSLIFKVTGYCSFKSYTAVATE